MPKPSTLAQATWHMITGLKHMHMYAVLRGDNENADQYRQLMHDHIDAYLDHQTEAAVAAVIKEEGSLTAAFFVS